MLSDLGANVIKVEPPKSGDLARTFGLRVDHMSLYFLQQNSGKRNISIDLTLPRGVELAIALARQVDVVVENFRPGVMQALGLDYETLAAANPRLVYCSISGYGQKVAWRHRKAYAPVIHAESGLTDIHLRKFGGDKPFEAISHADTYAALEGLAGVLAALYQRHRTGLGQHVDVSMTASMLAVNDRASTDLRADPPSRFDGGGLVAGTTATGRDLVISGDPVDNTVFGNYCQIMQRSDLLADPRFAERSERKKHRGELVEIIRGWILGFDDLDELEALLSSIHLPLGVVRSVKEVAGSEWAREWGAFARVSDRSGGTAEIAESPWRFSGARTGARGSAAFPGEHNRVAMRQLLGLSDDDIAALEEEGVLRSRLPDDRTLEAIPNQGWDDPVP
jgi:crotonobetainyl-CoA:carnitine CoA-transferase CaiB-like acyl-CoA transferase